MNIFFKLLVLLSGAGLMTGCDKEDNELNSRPPMEFYLLVEDAGTGVDLLNPETEGSLMNDRVCAILNGEKNYIGNLPGSGKFLDSRLTCNQFLMGDDRYSLCFSVGWTYDIVTTVIFDWGDDTKTQVDFLPHDYVNCIIWVDGVPASGKIGIVRK